MSGGQSDRQQRRAGSQGAVASPLLPKVLAMNLFLLPLNRMATRISVRNSVTCCRRLSHDCVGDVLRNIFLKECCDDDHCTNSSLAHELGYTWIHWKSPPKDRGRVVLQVKVNENAPLDTLLERSPKKKTWSWWRSSMRGMPEGQCKCHPLAGQFDFVPPISSYVNGLVNSCLNWGWYWNRNERTKMLSSSRSFCLHSQGRPRKESDDPVVHAVDSVVAMENPSNPGWVKHRRMQWRVVSTPFFIPLPPSLIYHREPCLPHSIFFFLSHCQRWKLLTLSLCFDLALHRN